ncbi:TRAP transporter large permease [Dietzia sp. CH92]|uniref:TRAP transporter large permease n=1 Tax=Dietzia sp. CH92 TaxID=3051823 RepID=UPI0028D24527|nr:TRAP transporter large permease [Dietzia sp. CH92]
MTTLNREPGTVGQDSSKDASARREGRFSVALLVAAIASAILTVALLSTPMDRLLVGVVALALMIALMMLKVPIGIVMLSVGSLGLLVLSSPGAVGGILSEVVYDTFASWSLSVVPMFVLMGVALGKSGIMANAYDSARKLVGWLPGGLAVSTNFAGAGMAATSGSTVGIVYAVGRSAIPEMIRSGYKPGLVMGSTAMVGALGQIIPPSLMLVIYAGVAETPVGPQLLAGMVPGLLLTLVFAAVIIGWAVLWPESAPRGRSYPWKERVASLAHLLPVLVIMIVVLGGIYAGVFTATEAGAYGAFVVLLMGLATVIGRANRDRKNDPAAPTAGRSVATYLSSTFMDTVAAVSAVFMLLVGVHVLTRLMTLSGVAQWVADTVVDLGLSKVGFLFVLIGIYLFLGLFLDTLAMMLLTIPVFMAPLVALDVDLIWFGVFLVILAEIGMVTPPLGILTFVVHSVAEASTKGMGVKMSLSDAFKGVVPFIIGCLLVLVLMIFVPDLALWLPGVSQAG